MENFTLYTPTKIYFGKGQENNIGNILKEYNVNKVLIHYGQGSVIKSGLLDKIKSLLDKANISYVCLGGVLPNPTLDLVYEGIKLCKKENVDFVLAIGGGSVLDSAKAIANGVCYDGDVWDFHSGKAILKASLKKGAILTISAAGSEMSNSAVISNSLTKQKCGFCSDLNRMNFAIENPELTYSVSKYQTACGIVDIAMHTIERYFDLGEAEFTDNLALSLIKSVFKFGKVAFNEPFNYEARANLMWASSVSHNGIMHAGKEFLLTVHQFEHVVSAYYPNVAHGAGLAALWCSWARYVYKSNIDRWYKYASVVFDIDDIDKDKAINKAIDLQEQYYKDIGMPTSLEELDIKKEDLETFALSCSKNKTRIINGYKKLDYDDMLNIYKLAFFKR